MPSVRAFLLSISLLLLAAVPAASQTADTQSYTVGIKVRGQEITGIALLEPQADGTLAGAIVNDFGVKVYDFTYAAGKARISNVIAPLNKWYIRKVLRKDLTYILQSLTGDTAAQDAERLAKARRSVEQTEDGTLTLTNHRFKIVYTLSPMHENNEVSE